MVLHFIITPYIIYRQINILVGFPGGSDGKESACNTGDAGSIPELGRSSGEGNGNFLQYSCLGNPMDRGESDMTQQLSNDNTHFSKLIGIQLSKHFEI